MLEPKGNKVTVPVFCNADFAANLVTGRLQTSLLIFINNASMAWYSKRNNTFKASTFGSEFIVLCVDCKMNNELRHKLYVI